MLNQLHKDSEIRVFQNVYNKKKTFWAGHENE